MDRNTRDRIDPQDNKWIEEHLDTEYKPSPGEITELVDIVEKKITTQEVDDAVQIELAIVLNLLAKMEQGKTVSRNKRNLTLALKTLGSDQPNLSFVRGLRKQLEWDSIAYSKGLPRILRRIAGPTPISAMVSGVLATIIIFPISYIILVTQNEIVLQKHFDMSTVNILVGGAFVGGVVSILSRLEQFGTLQLYNPNLVFLTAFWKPLLGVMLSLFAYCIFASDFIQISGFDFLAPTAENAVDEQAILLAHQKHYLIIWALGFICGFSERFTRDLVRGVENKLTSSSGDNSEEKCGHHK